VSYLRIPRPGERACGGIRRSCLRIVGRSESIGRARAHAFIAEERRCVLVGAQVRRPEQEGKWSVLHVVRHLADSELVSAVRWRMVVAQNRASLVAYDQDVWAERLRYSHADAEEALDEFMAVRRSKPEAVEEPVERGLDQGRRFTSSAGSRRWPTWFGYPQVTISCTSIRSTAFWVIPRWLSTQC
jgi:hypothetical protein